MSNSKAFFFNIPVYKYSFLKLKLSKTFDHVVDYENVDLEMLKIFYL